MSQDEFCRIRLDHNLNISPFPKKSEGCSVVVLVFLKTVGGISAWHRTRTRAGSRGCWTSQMSTAYWAPFVWHVQGSHDLVTHTGSAPLPKITPACKSSCLGDRKYVAISVGSRLMSFISAQSAGPGTDITQNTSWSSLFLHIISIHKTQSVGLNCDSDWPSVNIHCICPTCLKHQVRLEWTAGVWTGGTRAQWPHYLLLWNPNPLPYILPDCGLLLTGARLGKLRWVMLPARTATHSLVFGRSVCSLTSLTGGLQLW